MRGRIMGCRFDLIEWDLNLETPQRERERERERQK